MKRVYITVVGRVQGVGFRYSLYIKALQLGIKGWVKNKDDNKVEAVFEGEQDKINHIIEFCKKGPFHANISNIKIKEEQYKGEEKFRILR